MSCRPVPVRGGAGPDPGERFERERERLFAAAYLMLGSAAEAEDVVREAAVSWWRLPAAERRMIAAPGSWLIRTVANRCLNVLGSAHPRREAYVGPWLPEPVPTEEGRLGSGESALRGEWLSLASLVLLERLTPAERAVFVLHEAFGYRHARIAGLLGAAAGDSRQLLRRARERIGSPRSRFEEPADQRRRMMEEFSKAASDGDPAGLEELLAQDVVAWADGGGTVAAARRPVLGAQKVSRYIADLLARAPRGLELTVAEVNGEPSVVAVLGQAVVGVLVPEFAPEGIIGLRNVVNPRKLAFFGRQWSRLPTP